MGKRIWSGLAVAKETASGLKRIGASPKIYAPSRRGHKLARYNLRGCHTLLMFGESGSVYEGVSEKTPDAPSLFSRSVTSLAV